MDWNCDAHGLLRTRSFELLLHDFTTRRLARACESRSWCIISWMIASERLTNSSTRFCRSYAHEKVWARAPREIEAMQMIDA
eukprot:4388927-Pleurochrysis_carterae.AAC.2